MTRVSLRAAAVALGVLTAALAAVVVAATPWEPIAANEADTVEPEPLRDFSVEERDRADGYASLVRPPAYAALVLGLAAAAVLGLTPLGARLVVAVTRSLGARWAWRVVLGTVAVAAVARLVVLPLDARVEVVRRRYGLSTRSWWGWLSDLSLGWLISTGLTVTALLGLVALARALPRWWWVPAAGGGATLVLAVSFAYPLVVEPVFNRFQPMGPGALRSSLLELARADGVPVDDVLVADASRRTSALNAYVSGYGTTRRIVVYDTLLAETDPAEVRVIVAHELGHAKRNDVLHATLLGALGAGASVCLLAILTACPPLLRRAGASGPGDPRVVPLLLLVIAVLAAGSGPVQALVSRRIEARADVHALDLARDPAATAAMQRRLALVNLNDLDPPPVVFALFATHPTAPQRIALARTWARLHGVPEPPPLAPPRGAE